MRSCFLVVLFFFLSFGLRAQQAFHIVPLKPVAELRREALASPSPRQMGKRTPELVELVKLDPEIKLDIRYASSDNFMGAAVYEEARAFLQRPAAEALARVNRHLRPQGYGLIVHDAYRPWYITKMFWDGTPGTPAEKRAYVADPRQGSNHNRGCAVDLSLYDRKTGKEVEMPSDYDEMSPRAFTTYRGGRPEARRLRDLLHREMAADGFRAYAYEWWHFDCKDANAYPIMNVSFREIVNRK